MNSETSILVALVLAVLIIAAIYSLANGAVSNAGDSYEEGLLQNASSEDFFQNTASPTHEKSNIPVIRSSEVREWQM